MIEPNFEHPFTKQRSQHFWAHELMCISSKQPDSLQRMRYPVGPRYPTADTLQPAFYELDLLLCIS